MASTDLQFPPADGSIPVIPGFLDYHAKHNPNRSYYVFPLEDPDVTSISFKEFSNATHRAAHILRPGGASPDRTLVAILVHTDNVMYHALVVGAIRAGYIPFLVGARNSAAAIESMFVRTGCHHVITQPTFSSTIDAVRTALPADFALQVTPCPSFFDLFPAYTAGPGVAFDEPAPYPPSSYVPQPSDLVLYLHSSGSTGHPKPVPQYQKTLLSWCNSNPMVESQKRAVRWAAMALPPYHSLAFVLQMLTPLVSAQPTGLFAPRAPLQQLPVMATPQNTLEAARRTRSTAITCVPSMLETWSKSDEDVRFLASLQIVTTGGGPLGTATGMKLIKAGVHVYPTYGGTETGPTSRIFDADEDIEDKSMSVGKTLEDFEWLQLSEHTDVRFVHEDANSYELWFMNCPTHELCMENLTNGEHGYATSDLWEPHPTKPGLWKIVGRKDDVIVLSTGHNVVPIQPENHISTHPWISGALLFGRGRQQVGLLVELRPEHAIPKGDEAALVELRNEIWSVVEESNVEAPSFARIFKEMIIVAEQERPLVRAPKGTIIRKLTLDLYASEIDAVYDLVDDSTLSHGIAPPSDWTVAEVQPWILAHATFINGGTAIVAEADLFEQGFDSLSSTFLRNRIIGALRASSDPALNAVVHDVNPSFVFEHPTVVELATTVVQLIHAGVAIPSPRQAAIENMKAMIAKYSAQVPIAPRQKPRMSSTGEVVLLTGTTGKFGRHILAQLLADSRIERVYALNRGTALEERQAAAFREAKLPTSLLAQGKMILLSGDLSREDLGMEPAVVAQLQASVTHVLQCAWKVDLSFSLPSFEPQVAATVRLLRVFPGARFSFVSSAAHATQGWDIQERGNLVAEAPLSDPAVAVGSGYGMSKFVVEEIVTNARRAGVDATILRVGPLCGSAEEGSWSLSESDWVPALVKSSVAVGCMPVVDGVVSWLPKHAAAQAIVDMIVCPPGYALPVVNIVHPQHVSASEVFEAINDELPRKLQYVPAAEWVAKVQEHVTSETLLTRFRSLAGGSEGLNDVHGPYEMGGGPLFETAKAKRVSPTLAGLRPLGKHDVHAWLAAWREQGSL